MPAKIILFLVLILSLTLTGCNFDTSEKTEIETPAIEESKETENLLSLYAAQNRDIERKAGITEIAAAVETFNLDKGRYPQVNKDLCLHKTEEYNNDITVLIDNYLSEPPHAGNNSPSEEDCYYYRSMTNGFMVYINLETKSGKYDRGILDRGITLTKDNLLDYESFDSDLFALIRLTE